MILGLITLLTALGISSVAAYYSIVGLTAIFPGAFYPIIITGAALEIGKIVSTVWLHYNWKRAAWRLKLYLVPAVIVLMFITSMGIFGFLSKAHLDQAVPTGDVAAKVQIIEDKIVTQRENIAAAKTTLAQLDAQVNQALSRTTDLKGTNRSAQLRRQQKTERASLQNEIAAAQTEIVKLQEERAPLAAEYRKVEAEVGPIKYIAALVYGDEAGTDHNLLEKAVRAVIIIIVMVFDPLAIVLILAATTSLDWAREAKRRKEEPATVEPMPVAETTVNEVLEELEHLYQPDPEEEAYQAKLAAEAKVKEELAAFELAEAKAKLDGAIDSIQIAQEHNTLLVETINELNTRNSKELAAKDALLAEVSNLLEIADANISKLNQSYEALTTDFNKLHSTSVDSMNRAVGLENDLSAAKASLEAAITTKDRLQTQYDALLTTRNQLEDEVGRNKKLIDSLSSEIESLKGKAAPVVVEPVVEEKTMRGSSAHFGTSFPTDPYKGDLYLRVDYMPSKLFKWNDTKWIELDKNSTDTYTYDEQYIKLLVDKIASGEYDADDLSDVEQEQVKRYLGEPNVK